MTVESVTQIIGRAVVEPEYRALLFADQTTALNGYDLTEEEVAALQSLSRERFETMLADLRRKIENMFAEDSLRAAALEDLQKQLEEAFDFDE